MSVDPGDATTSGGINIDPPFRGLFFARAKKNSRQSVSFQQGKLYYFKLVTNASWLGYAAPELQLLAEAQGRQLLHKCKLSVIYNEPHYYLYEAGNGIF